MVKRNSFYVVALFSVAIFMTAGCATQDVVKKDEGIVSTPVAKKAEQKKSDSTPTNQLASPSAIQIKPSGIPAPEQTQARNTSPNSQLQSALEKIYFDFDSANLSESARNTLTKNAAILSKESSANVRIEGNCDERGSAEYNLALGERRAKSAQQYLIALGIKSDRLSIVSYGKEKPAVQGSDESAMAKNRRDEFVVTTK